jgi:hypothetical protein
MTAVVAGDERVMVVAEHARADGVDEAVDVLFVRRRPVLRLERRAVGGEQVDEARVLRVFLFQVGDDVGEPLEGRRARLVDDEVAVQRRVRRIVADDRIQLCARIG